MEGVGEDAGVLRRGSTYEMRLPWARRVDELLERNKQGRAKKQARARIIARSSSSSSSVVFFSTSDRG